MNYYVGKKYIIVLYITATLFAMPERSGNHPYHTNVTIQEILLQF